jgi:hypothetical protein
MHFIKFESYVYTILYLKKISFATEQFEMKFPFTKTMKHQQIYTLLFKMLKHKFQYSKINYHFKS